MLETSVRIISGHGYGSGVALYSDSEMTVVLTAHHVIEGREDDTAIVFEGSARPYVAAVLKADKEKDLALLIVGKGNQPVVSVMGRNKLERLETTYAAGYGSGLPLQLTQGYVIASSKTRVLTTATVTAGVSGGGLFIENNGRYKLAGIVIAMAAKNFEVKLKEKTVGLVSVPINHVSIAVNMETINDFLE